MKTLLVLLAVLPIIAAISCGDDPTKPRKSKPNYSGTFFVMDTLASSSCAETAPLGTTVNVTITGSSMIFAGFDGIWDEQNKHGYGVSPEVTVPIDPLKGCYSYYTVTFDITYVDVDNFYGIYHVDYRYSAECQAPACSFEFRIGGTRP